MVRRSLKKVLIILISNLVILSFVRAEATDVKWTVAHLDIPEVFYGFEIGKSNRYIMVGENGIIKHSVDGLKWSACTTNDNNVLKAVLWNGEKYLAVGDNGVILSSVDLITWSTYKYPEYGVFLRGVIWEKNQYIAIGSSLSGNQFKGVVFRSTNGSEWEKIQLKEDPLNSIAWNGERFIAVGVKGTIVSSLNGVSWEKVILEVDKSLTKVIWTGSQFLACGMNGLILSSIDGIKWESIVLEQNTTFNDVMCNNGQLMVVGDNGSIFKSTDGKKWSAVERVTASSLFCIKWDGKRYVSISHGGEVLVSDNGDKWKIISPNTYFNILNAVTNNNKIFVSVGSQGTIIVSRDGLSWDKKDSGITDSLIDVVWDGKKFVAVTNRGEVLYSSDCEQWLKGMNIPFSPTQKVIWSGSRFVAIGSSGKIAVSGDGLEWETSFSSTDKALTDILWDGKQFIAVGFKGVILTSADGITWNNKAPKINDKFDHVLLVNNDIIALGTRTVNGWAKGFTAKIVDGEVTNSNIIENVQIFHKVVWNGSQIIGTDSYGNVIYSLDGINWVIQYQSSIKGLKNPQLNSIAWNSKILLMVGSGGTIITTNLASSMPYSIAENIDLKDKMPFKSRNLEKAIEPVDNPTKETIIIEENKKDIISKPTEMPIEDTIRPNPLQSYESKESKPSYKLYYYIILGSLSVLLALLAFLFIFLKDKGNKYNKG